VFFLSITPTPAISTLSSFEITNVCFFRTMTIVCISRRVLAAVAQVYFLFRFYLLSLPLLLPFANNSLNAMNAFLSPFLLLTDDALTASFSLWCAYHLCTIVSITLCCLFSPVAHFSSLIVNKKRSALSVYYHTTLTIAAPLLPDPVF